MDGALLSGARGWGSARPRQGPCAMSWQTGSGSRCSVGEGAADMALRGWAPARCGRLNAEEGARGLKQGGRDEELRRSRGRRCCCLVARSLGDVAGWRRPASGLGSRSPRPAWTETEALWVAGAPSGGARAPARHGDHVVRTRHAWSGIQREAVAAALLLLGAMASAAPRVRSAWRRWGSTERTRARRGLGMEESGATLRRRGGWRRLWFL